MNLQSFSKNRKKGNAPGEAEMAAFSAFKEWIIANNQAIMDRKYRSFLISQTCIDQSFNEYHLKP
jgi:hypothetical protein